MRSFPIFVRPKSSFRFIPVAILLIAFRIGSAQTTAPSTSDSVEPQYKSLAEYSAASAATEWQCEPTISGGYSNIHYNGNNAIPYNRNGGYIDANIYDRLPPNDSPLFGLGISASGNWDDYTIAYPTAPFYRSFYADTNMVSAEVRLAFPFGLPDAKQGFYCLPRVGIGVLVDNFAVGQPYYDYPNYYFATESNHTGFGVEVRPDIELGYRIKRFNIGFETSYMAAWANFGKLGNFTQEFRLGLAVGYRF
jgi:hypothetical protein